MSFIGQAGDTFLTVPYICDITVPYIWDTGQMNLVKF